MEGPRGRVLWRALAFVGAMALGSTAFAQEAELEQAAQHMREGKPGEAYALLEPLESQHAGELRFDYL